MNNLALAEGEKIAFRGIIKLIILGTLKMVAGLVTGLTVMIADAVSTFADTLGLFASYLGLRLSRRTADKNFEYGYYKFETFMAFLVSVGIIYLGYIVLLSGIENLKTPEIGEFRILAVLTTGYAIFHSTKFSIELTKAGQKANSLSLLANARDKKMDVIAGFGILLSILANYQNIPYIEGTVTIIISLIIFKEGLEGSKESLFFLLDYWNDPGLYNKIKKAFKEEEDVVLEVKKLRLRRAGTFIFGEAFVEINPFAGIQDLREELGILQDKVKQLDPYIKDFAIYSHIPTSEKVKIAVPLKRGLSLKSQVASTLKETTAYLFANIKNGKIKDYYVKPLKKDDKNPIQLANFLKKEKVNILVDNKLNSVLYFNLRRIHHIFVYPNFEDIGSAEDTIKLLLLDT